MGDELTRYLKPVKKGSFSDFQVLQAMINADVDPEEIASVCQIKSFQCQVIRVTMKTQAAAASLDELLGRRGLSVKGVVLAEVVGGEGGFVEVTLENVPQFISDSDVEEEMGRFGKVASSEKGYIDIGGHRVCNEKRVVLFSSVHDATSLSNSKIAIGNFMVHASMENINRPSVPLRKKKAHRTSPDRRKSYHGESGRKKDVEGVVSMVAGVNRSFNCRQCAGGSSGGGMCKHCGRGMIRRGTTAGVSRGEIEIDWKTPPKDELLEFLRGRKRDSRDTMSAVAYRQSMVVRDDGGLKNNLNDDVTVSGNEALMILEKVRRNKESFKENTHRRPRTPSKEVGKETEKISSLGWLKRFGSNKLEKLGFKRDDKKVRIKEREVSRSQEGKNSKKVATEAPVVRKSCLKKTFTDYGVNKLDAESATAFSYTSLSSSSLSRRRNALSTTHPSSNNTNVLENIRKLVKSPQKKKHDTPPPAVRQSKAESPRGALHRATNSGGNGARKHNQVDVPLGKKLSELRVTMPSNHYGHKDIENHNSNSNRDKNDNRNSSNNDSKNQSNNNKGNNNSSNNSNNNKGNNNNSNNNMSDAYDEFSKQLRRQKRTEAIQQLSAYLMY